MWASRVCGRATDRPLDAEQRGENRLWTVDAADPDETPRDRTGKPHGVALAESRARVPRLRYSCQVFPDAGYHASFPVPRDLRPYVHRVFVVNAPMQETMRIPASHRSYLFIHFGPTASVRGRSFPSGPGVAHVTGPATQPFPTSRLGPRFHFLAVDFTAVGMHGLFRTPTASLRDRLVPLDALVGFTEASRLQHEMAELVEDRARVDRVLRFLRRRLPAQERAAARHARRFLSLASGDPSRPVSECVRDLGISAPLLRRSVAEVCGVSPKRLMSSARLGRALTRLVDAEPSSVSRPQGLTELAHELEFYDQPHFTHAFRRFTGYAPSRLPRDAFLLARLMMQPGPEPDRFVQSEGSPNG